MTNIINTLKEFLYNKICYLGDKGLEPLSNQTVANTLVLIVKKSFFFETEKTYPIANRLHLTKALKLDASTLCPFDGFNYVYSINKSESGHKVHFWFYKQDLLTQLDDSIIKKIKFLIPENYLIFKALKPGQSVYVDNDYYVSNSATVQTFNSSELKSNELKANELNISNKDALYNLLKLGLYKSLPNIFNFKLNLYKAESIECKYCSYIKNGIIAGVAYLLLSSILIKSLDVYFQNKSDLNTVAISEYRKLKAEYKKQFNTHTELESQLINKLKPDAIFKLLSKTTEPYTIERIILKKNQVFITATSEQPLQVLEEVIKLDGISQVRFANKVADLNQSELKRFTLTYQY